MTLIGRIKYVAEKSNRSCFNQKMRKKTTWLKLNCTLQILQKTKQLRRLFLPIALHPHSILSLTTWVGLEVGHQYCLIIHCDTEDELFKNSIKFTKVKETKTLFREHLICTRLANLRPPNKSYTVSNCWFFSHHPSLSSTLQLTF